MTTPATPSAFEFKQDGKPQGTHHPICVKRYQDRRQHHGSWRCECDLIWEAWHAALTLAAGQARKEWAEWTIAHGHGHCHTCDRQKAYWQESVAKDIEGLKG